MAASTTDLITQVVSGSTRPVATTVTATRSAAGTTLTCAALTGWETATKVHFATYSTDASGNKIDSSQCDWSGIVSGSTITNLALTAGTDVGNSIGQTVECMPTAAWADELARGVLNHSTPAGDISATNTATFNAHIDINDSSTAIRDSSDNELVKFVKTGSAVNELTVTNAATANAPQLSATGGDANIDLKLTPKGTGRVVLNGAGDSAVARVATSEPTTSTSYADLATTTDTVTVTVGASGKVSVKVGALLSNNTADSINTVSFAVSGASTVAAGTYYTLMQTSGANRLYKVSETFLITGLTAGSNTFKMKYKVATGGGGAGTMTASDREIWVEPK